MRKIIVTEVQTNGDTVTTLPFAYDTMNEAEAKYHSVLAVAAVSNVPTHACIMYDNEGFPIKHECFWHGEQEEE